MTTNILNTKISESENRILDTINLVTTTVRNTKISEVENKFQINYFPRFNKLTTKTFPARLKTS